MESKVWYKSKSMVFNLLLSVAGVVATLGYLPQVKEYIASHADLFMTGLGLVGVALRAFKSNISILSQE